MKNEFCCSTCVYLDRDIIKVKQVFEEGNWKKEYRKYGCKKNVYCPGFIVKDAELKQMGCSKWKYDGQTIKTGDCFYVVSEASVNKFNYCGRVEKKRLLYDIGKMEYVTVSDRWIKNKKVVVYASLPELARKRRKRYLEKNICC